MDKLSRSEAGKLGSIAAQPFHDAATKARRDAYDLSAVECKLCTNKIPYEKRRNSFCSQSCNASYQNYGKDRWAGKRSDSPSRLRKVEKHCKRCSQPMRALPDVQHCSFTCANSDKRDILVSDWLAGLIEGHTGKTLQIRGWLRQYILDQAGSACSICGWAKRHSVDGKPLVEIDHIDGNAANSRPDNLRVLCPNCHSETPTFRNRNAKSSRDRS